MIPPRIVLAAVDFSDSSRIALTFAARLARSAGAALHVMHAEEPLLVAAAQAKQIDLAAETRDELAIFARSASPAAGCSPVLHVAAGAPAQAIREMAHRIHADLVVVGMRGISAAEHLMFGSTTEGILRSADVPLVAVPDGWTPPSPESEDLAGLGPVVAAVDLSESSLAAARAGGRLAGMLRTSVEAIHVIPAVRVLNRWQGHASAATGERERAARGELERALAGLEPAVPLTIRVESGNVAQCIADAVARSGERCPILVIGRREHAAGSTAYRILTLANAPVLQVAREPDAAA